MLWISCHLPCWTRRWAMDHSSKDRNRIQWKIAITWAAKDQFSPRGGPEITYRHSSRDRPLWGEGCLCPSPTIPVRIIQDYIKTKEMHTTSSARSDALSPRNRTRETWTSVSFWEWTIITSVHSTCCSSQDRGTSSKATLSGWASPWVLRCCCEGRLPAILKGITISKNESIILWSDWLLDIITSIFKLKIRLLIIKNIKENFDNVCLWRRVNQAQTSS